MDGPAAPRVASRTADIAPFHVMDILARARQLEAAGRDIVHLEIGEPDFATPAPIIAAGQAALAAGQTHYTPATGLPALREAISGHYRKRFGIDVSPTRIVVTPGASGALQLLLGVLVEVGQRVLLPDPGYPCNRHMVSLFGGVPTPLQVRDETGFNPGTEQVEQAWDEQTRLLMLASPANPTGMVIPPALLADLYQLVRRRGGGMLVDEIYQGLVYGQSPVTALSLGQEELFVVNSFSKYFSMTGWRLGWLVAPESYVPLLDRLAQNLFLAAPTPAQYAALAAFDEETIRILEARRERFRQRRDFLHQGLSALGFGLSAPPQGAFYLYADSSVFADDSFDLAGRLLEHAGVAVTPGKDFGRYQANQYLRFAYTTSRSRLEVGLQRLGGFLRAGAD